MSGGVSNVAIPRQLCISNLFVLISGEYSHMKFSGFFTWLVQKCTYIQVNEKFKREI